MERMQGKDDEHRHQHVHPQEYTHSQKQRGSHQHESRRSAFHRVFETGPPVHHAGRYDSRNHREKRKEEHAVPSGDNLAEHHYPEVERWLVGIFNAMIGECEHVALAYRFVGYAQIAEFV